MDRNWVSSAGPEVTLFEAMAAQVANRTSAVAVVNGTAALHLALLAAGVKPGDRVVVPDWAFAASVNAVCHAGAVPVFVDISAVDWAIDPELLEIALDADRGIKAVIAVDPLGHAADFDRLADVCQRRGVCLIEDAAGAIGGSFKSRPCGSFGELSIYSFNGNKTVTAGGGGMVLTNDARKAAFVRHLSTQARPTREYVHDHVGFNYRMTNVNAAIGLAQLERLSEMVAAKRAIAARYDAALAGRADVEHMLRPVNTQSSCWLYSVRLADEADARSLVQSMDAAGIEARIFWRSLSAQSPWSHLQKHVNGTAAALSGTIVSLPSSSNLLPDEQERVISSLNEWRGARPWN
ncbi:MAG: aminotransferase class I/II-fold pyridoxal phosphate-dependent enzyme [Hyphomicrobium sp.]